MRTAERGFTLLELVVCVGVLALASVATIGALAAAARNAAAPAARDVALMAAENALARAHAASAYAASPAQDVSAQPAARTWALVSGETRFVAGAELRAPAACGGTAPLALKLPVVTTYDPAAERFTVVVTYPRDPCRVAPDGTIPAGESLTATLSATLPPSVYPPGQVVHRDVMPPARM